MRPARALASSLRLRAVGGVVAQIEPPPVRQLLRAPTHLTEDGVPRLVRVECSFNRVIRPAVPDTYGRCYRRIIRMQVIEA
jgi:hypothetical protein